MPASARKPTPWRDRASRGRATTSSATTAATATTWPGPGTRWACWPRSWASRHGVCGGIGGSQHLCAPGFKSNGVLGGTVPAAAGIALAMKLAATDAISMVFIGDGTLGRGRRLRDPEHGSAVGAAAAGGAREQRLVAEHADPAEHGRRIAGRFAAFGIPSQPRSTRTDVLEIDARRGQAVARVRATRRPQGLVIHTYRLCHHSKSDDNRPEDEIAERWATRAAGDPRPPPARRRSGAHRCRRRGGARRDRGDGEARRDPRSSAGCRPAPTCSRPIRAWSCWARTSPIPTAARSRSRGACRPTSRTGCGPPRSARPASPASRPGLALSGYRPIVEIMFGDFVTLASIRSSTT